MKAVVKAAIYDAKAGVLRQPGDVVEMTAKRIDEINAAYPGTIEKAAANKPASK